MSLPTLNAGSPLPATPQRRPRTSYQDLLHSFGSRSSATSVTKQRRAFALGAGKGAREEQRELSNPPPPSETRTQSHLSETASTAPAVASTQKPIPKPPAQVQVDGPSDKASAPSPIFPTPQKSRLPEVVSSPDELQRTPEETLKKVNPPRKKTSRRLHSQKILEGLKMEEHKRGRSHGPRRSARNRASDILASDTRDELAASPRRIRNAQAPLRPKLDTARQRLRDDIAAKTKAKADRFMVAHREKFLPLLPQNNHVAKLRTAGDTVPYEELTEQPRGVKATMKPYQLTGLSFLAYLHHNGMSGILGDEMGLGKTLQTLSLFQYLEERDEELGIQSEELRPYLIVCPLSVLNSWVSEANRWVPDLKVLRFHGSAKERTRLKKVAMGVEDQYGNETIQSRDRKRSRKAGIAVSRLPTGKATQSYRIIVTTYEALLAEQSWFKHSFIWRYIVLDEGHRVKNSGTDVSKALKPISAEYRLILTGTPLQNNLTEMWGLLAWLYPHVFTETTSTLFKDSFDLTRGKYDSQVMDGARRLLELIMLRRMKNSPGVDLKLPPKEEVLLYVPLTPMQRFWYTRLLTRIGDSMLDELFNDSKTKEKQALQEDKEEDLVLSKVERLELKAESTHDANDWQETAQIMREALQKEKAGSEKGSAWQRLMNLVLQLRKCCSHPYLLPGACPDPYYLGQHVIQASGKFILLEKLLNHSIFRQGKKTLIFSGFTRTLDCCEDLLTLLSDHGRKFKFLRLDGSSQRARRNLDIRMFNTHDDYKVMLLSIRAGGLGINLTSAEDVVFLDEDWNPQITLQAEARAHRIGQTKKVTIYKLCTQGTVEEQMMGRIRKKLFLSAKITESMQNIHASGGNKRARSSANGDMPQMDASQLKSLVRRGAQTLSHPDINIHEMLSWDLDTMMNMCRDKPADPHINADAATTEVDEAKWLSVMERVECAVFEGKRIQKQKAKESALSNILPDSIRREDRRKGKNTTVEVDGFAINKESMNCAQWEAVPTLAGKDSRLAEPKREKRPEITHEGHCLACFDDGKLISCKSCPRSYHYKCLEPEFQAKYKSLGGFTCAQHECVDCEKKTGDAGGLIFRCRWCENGFCEDCLEWDNAELIGENLPEFDMLGDAPPNGGFYIKCPQCKEAMEEHPDRRQWLEAMETSYDEQHKQWLQDRDQEVKKLEAEREREEKAKRGKESQDAMGLTPDAPIVDTLDDLDDEEEGVGALWHTKLDTPSEMASTPALTDTEATTPALGGSGFSTPSLRANGVISNGTAKRTLPLAEAVENAREEKRTKLNKSTKYIMSSDSEDEVLPIRNDNPSKAAKPGRR